jgi:hypothetical protein
LPVHFYSIRHDIKGITVFQGITGKIGIDILQSFKLYIFNTLQAKDLPMPSKKKSSKNPNHPLKGSTIRVDPDQEAEGHQSDQKAAPRSATQSLPVHDGHQHKFESI